MDYQPELVTLLAIAVIGQGTLAPFEVETSRWRKILKWAIVIGMTLAARRAIGHAAVALPLVLATAGVVFHVVWCRRHGIDALNATPRRRYYELRGWPWRE